MINPPLASTAIAVVPPRQAGMGSGINSTFRQLGIATGIAALGSIFTSEIRTHVTAGLRAAHQAGASALSAAINNGHALRRSARCRRRRAPRPARSLGRASSPGLNDLFLVAAFVAFVGGVGALVADPLAGLRLTDRWPRAGGGGSRRGSRGRGSLAVAPARSAGP